MNTELPPELYPLDQYNEQLRDAVAPEQWTNPVPADSYNLVVIGGGTAGLVAAAGAAGVGAKVALIERHLLGGDCLNSGCVPSKALIASARCIAAIKQADSLGVTIGSTPTVRFDEVMQRMRRLRAGISPHDSAKRFKELGVDVFLGWGRFIADRKIEIDGPWGNASLRFAKAIIATGSTAAVPKLPGLDTVNYLTNQTLFSLTQLPESMAVIGGGAIGCEMAQTFARFGCRVTLFERGRNVLAREDTIAVTMVQNNMLADGVDIVTEATIDRVAHIDPSQQIEVNFHRQTDPGSISVAALLVATGRTPRTSGLGLDLVGVKFDDRSGIQVDDSLRTSNRRIYASGDVCSRFKFTHAADFMSRMAIQNALFFGRKKTSQLIIPRCTYTSPEIAQVGLTQREAADAGIDVDCYEVPLSRVDRAILDGEENGVVRILCGKGGDEIVGATIVAEGAGDMIGEIVLAMTQRIGLGKIANAIHPYPTRAEAIRKAGDLYQRTRLTPMIAGLLKTWLRYSR